MPHFTPTPTLVSPKKLQRRSLLKLALTAGLFVYAMAKNSVANSQPYRDDEVSAKSATPRQTEGPFYPIHEQADKDVDLTRIEGRSQTAKGEVIRVQGRVLDTNGRLLSDALVEIWQANTWGRYRHKRDPNTAPLDPDFQGWGVATTGSNGRYGFKTILPGAYPAGPGWIRPPHIHFKVARPGYEVLTTQMYFPDQKFNDADLILQNLSAAQQNLVIAKRQANGENDAPVFVFDIVLLAAS